jgi:hypothetical protein
MGIQLLTKPKRNMKNKLMPLLDKLKSAKAFHYRDDY